MWKNVYRHLFLTSSLDEGYWTSSLPGYFTPRERARDNRWIRCLGHRAVLDISVRLESFASSRNRTNISRLLTVSLGTISTDLRGFCMYQDIDVKEGLLKCGNSVACTPYRLKISCAWQPKFIAVRFKYHSQTCLLTLWSRVLLEKLICFQLVKKFSAFYGTRKFITAFTSARHLTLSWASSIQSKPTSHFL